MSLWNIICDLFRNNFTKIIICQDKENYLLSVKVLSEILKNKKINYSIAKSIKEGIKILTNIDVGGYVGLIFGSHYIAKEVYSEF